MTRYISSDARSFFSGAIDDVDLIREVITETALNGGVGHRMTLVELNGTLDTTGRDYLNDTSIKTTLEAVGSYVDDRPDRRVDFWVGLRDLNSFGTYYNKSSRVDPEVELAIIQGASLIFPWILDRRSMPEFWYVDHQNGRSTGTKKVPFRFDSLYTAAWIGSWGEAWQYFPPLVKLADGYPTTFADPWGAGATANASTHGLPFVEANLPWNNPEREVFFTSPYPDNVQPGKAIISSIGPVYFTGTIANKTFDDTYIASTGLDIALDSMSELLDVLTESHGRPRPQYYHGLRSDPRSP